MDNKKEEKLLVRKRVKKVNLDVNLENLRLVAETGKLIYGNKEVAKAIKKKQKIYTVFLAKNAREDVLSKIEQLCKLNSINIIYIDSSLAIGQAIGKPFLVSAVAILEKGEAKI